MVEQKFKVPSKKSTDLPGISVIDQTKCELDDLDDLMSNDEDHGFQNEYARAELKKLAT